MEFSDGAFWSLTSSNGIISIIYSNTGFIIRHTDTVCISRDGIYQEPVSAVEVFDYMNQLLENERRLRIESEQRPMWKKLYDWIFYK